MADLVSCNVDTRNLMRGIELALEYSKRTPAIAVNTVAYLVAWDWYHGIPAASSGAIDAKLSVPATLKVATGRKKAPKNSLGLDVGDAIVLARTNPNSRYSQMTGNYWPLKKPDFSHRRTDSTTKFIVWMTEAKERRKKAIHSSTHYLKSCVIPAIRALRPFASKSAGGGGDFTMEKISGKGVIAGSGWGTPARKGSTVAVCEIANAAGMDGKNGVLSAKHNLALHRVATVPLQNAINKQFDKTTQYISKQEMERDRREYESLGFKVS